MVVQPFLQPGRHTVVRRLTPVVTPSTEPAAERFASHERPGGKNEHLQGFTNPAGNWRVAP